MGLNEKAQSIFSRIYLDANNGAIYFYLVFNCLWSNEMMTAHHLKIIETLKRGWHTQMDIALKGISLNLSKRLCEIEPEIATIGWKVERKWKDKPRCKLYRIVRTRK